MLVVIFICNLICLYFFTFLQGSSKPKTICNSYILLCFDLIELHH